MKQKVTYHSSITGKFVSKKYAEDNPDTTVKVTSCKFNDLKSEFIKIGKLFSNGNISDKLIESIVVDYMNRN